MLERAHGAGIHIDVGIQLHECDLEAARFQQRTQGGGGDALAQRGHHTAGDKDVSGHENPDNAEPVKARNGSDAEHRETGLKATRTGRPGQSPLWPYAGVRRGFLLAGDKAPKRLRSSRSKRPRVLAANMHSRPEAAPTGGTSGFSSPVRRDRPGGPPPPTGRPRPPVPLPGTTRAGVPAPRAAPRTPAAAA